MIPRLRAHRATGYGAFLATAAALLWALAFSPMAALAAGHISAEQYVAAHGFSEPEHLGRSESSTRVGLAFDAGNPVVYWYDSTGVSRMPLLGDGGLRQIVEARGTRDLSAVTVNGEPALAVVTRDFGTGRNDHAVTWRDERRTVLSSLQVHDLALEAGTDGPIWAVRRSSELGSALTVGGWARPELVVRETDESIAGYDLTAAPDGAWWVSWLEGSTDQTALGAFSDWRAYVARVAPDGQVSAPLELGSAASRGRMDVTRVSIAPPGDVQILWPRDDARLVATQVAPVAPQDASGAADSAGELQRVDLLLGTGMAIGVFDGAAYWADGDRVRRQQLEPGSITETVLWAPNAIEAIDAESGPAGELFLAWYGGTLRGGFAVYSAGTHEPFRPGWTDRWAALMGWNPWDVWSEALGQTLSSLLAGVLVTMALSPLLWIVVALLVRFTRIQNWALLGIAAGGGVLTATLLVVRLLAQLPAPAVSSLFGTWWQIALSLTVAAAATYALRRGSDTEPLLGTLVAASTSAGMTIAILSFFTFQAWSDMFRGVL